MTGATVKVNFADGALRAALVRVGALRPALLKAIGSGLIDSTKDRFETEADPHGTAWVDLLPSYALIKRGPGLLRASGMLQRSITMRVNGNRVLVGSNRIYAAVHQFGAVIKPKTADALAFQLGVLNPPRRKGGRPKVSRVWVHAQSVTIPARPYLGFGPADRRAVLDVLEHEIGRTLLGRPLRG